MPVQPLDQRARHNAMCPKKFVFYVCYAVVLQRCCFAAQWQKETKKSTVKPLVIARRWLMRRVGLSIKAGSRAGTAAVEFP